MRYKGQIARGDVKERLLDGLILFITSILLLILQGQAASAACPSFSDVISNGSYAVADEDGKIISSCNPDKSFVPASLIKIQTALAALQILGKDFRFETEFYIDRADNLYIKGFGDPLLTSEEVERILLELQRLGIVTVNAIYIDTSSYELEEQVPGKGTSDNPYDAPVGALGVNFNTVSIRVQSHGKVISDELQTPTLPVMNKLGRGLKPGSYRLNICQKGCQPEVQSVRLAAELFRGVQQRLSIKGNGPFGAKGVPDDATLIYTHKNSQNLRDLVFSFLKYSNNYLANQVFLACGVKKYGFPATWEKAVRAVREALTETLGGDTPGQITMVEGSGLSRQNRVTARAMVQVLQAFQPYAELFQEKKGALIKSGTLKGVYNYAGYLGDGKSFVIILNQQENTRDNILKRIRKKY